MSRVGAPGAEVSEQLTGFGVKVCERLRLDSDFCVHASSVCGFSGLNARCGETLSVKADRAAEWYLTVRLRADIYLYL